MLSHELRTPLMPLLGWADLLVSKKLNESDSEEALKSILRSAKTQLRLVEDLLDVSRIITNKLQLTITPVALEPIILQAISMVRPAAEDKGVHLQTVLDHGVGAVPVDSFRLEQVITNLVSNAIKFTPSGGRIELRLEQVERYARIRVMDTGCGISADFLPFVFDRLRQADSSDSRQYGGLGLGLSIVRHVVALHGGTIQAESAGADQGSTFIVQLPLDKLI
jgi:signal transduction histidine kinase